MHQWASWKLASQLQRQLPPGLTALTDVEVTIDSSHPPTVRAPDVIVVPNSAIEADRARGEAAEVTLAVEIVSAGSVRTDRVFKMFEYAEASIPCYWIIDLGAPASLKAYGLVDGEYKLMTSGSGVASVESPVPLAVDVAALVTPR